MIYFRGSISLITDYRVYVLVLSARPLNSYPMCTFKRERERERERERGSKKGEEA